LNPTGVPHKESKVPKSSRLSRENLFTKKPNPEAKNLDIEDSALKNIHQKPDAEFPLNII